MAPEVPRAPDRRPEDTPPDPAMAQGGRVRGRPVDEDRGRDAARCGGFTPPGERVPAPCLRPVGPAVADSLRHGRHDRRALRRPFRPRVPTPPRGRTVPHRTGGTVPEVRPGLAPREDAPDRIQAVPRLE